MNTWWFLRSRVYHTLIFCLLQQVMEKAVSRSHPVNLMMRLVLARRNWAKWGTQVIFLKVHKKVIDTLVFIKCESLEDRRNRRNLVCACQISTDLTISNPIFFCFKAEYHLFKSRFYCFNFVLLYIYFQFYQFPLCFLISLNQVCNILLLKEVSSVLKWPLFDLCIATKW